MIESKSNNTSENGKKKTKQQQGNTGRCETLRVSESKSKNTGDNGKQKRNSKKEIQGGQHVHPFVLLPFRLIGVPVDAQLAFLKPIIVFLRTMAVVISTFFYSTMQADSSKVPVMAAQALLGLAKTSGGVHRDSLLFTSGSVATIITITRTTELVVF